MRIFFKLWAIRLTGLIVLCICTCFLGEPSCVYALEPTVKFTDEIVVTGTKRTQEDIRRDATVFTRRISALPIDGQVARWKTPICPKATYVDDVVANAISKRIRDLAHQVGAPVADEPCKTNVVVTFTTDSDLLINEILKKQPRAIVVSEPNELKLILKSSTPVRWWYGSITEGVDGHQLTGDPSPALLGADIPTNDRQKYLGTYSNSLIGTNIRVNIESANILVDVSRAEGFKLSSVIDYIGFVALARVRISASANGIPSILALFSPESHISHLSGWDLAYLSALYSVPVNRTAEKQKILISTKMSSYLRQ